MSNRCNGQIHVKKASGEIELFSPEKLKGSLIRSDANEEIVDQILDEICKWVISGTTTRKIYSKAFSLLRKKTISNAARYKLKSAIMELGPTGYPFEYFVGEIYKVLGYDTEVSKVIQGKYITHEVDVIASKEKHQRFIECKYYQSSGKYANVQVSLYIKSRVDDIISYREALPEYKEFTFSGGIVTNTRFTEDAEKFGISSGLNLLSWNFPEGKGIKDIIDKHSLFPITSLSSLSKADKQKLLKKDVVICKQILEDNQKLDLLEINQRKRDKIIKEIRDLCE